MNEIESALGVNHIATNNNNIWQLLTVIKVMVYSNGLQQYNDAYDQMNMVTLKKQNEIQYNDDKILYVLNEMLNREDSSND